MAWESRGDAACILLCIGKSIDEEQMMRTKTVLIAIGATAALGVGGAVTGTAALGDGTSSASSSPVAATATARHVEGLTVAVSRRAGAFTVRDRERGTVTLTVTVLTRFDRIAGFSALRTGRSVDVHAVRVNGRLVATKVETGAGARLGSHHSRRQTGVWHSWTSGDDRVGHDLGDNRGQDLAGHDGGDDRGGQRGMDDGTRHDRGDDHGGGQSRQ